MDVTIGEILEQTVKKYPNKLAIYDVNKSRRWNYSQWNVYINKLANAFIDVGVRKGDRISAFLFNSSEFVATFFACAKIGAIFNPINFRLKSEELSYIIENSEAKILVFENALEPEVSKLLSVFPNLEYWCIDENCPSYSKNFNNIVESTLNENITMNVSENDLYTIMYTSGTTGRPKGVLHTHRDVIEQSMLVINAMQYTDRTKGLIVAPLFHCAELHCGLFSRVHAGGSNVILSHFDVRQVLNLLENERITTMFAVPTMWKMMLQEDLSNVDLSSLKTGMYGGESMPPSIVSKCQQTFNIKLIQAYGMTEMGPTISFLMNEDQIIKAGSAGIACLNHEIRIVKPNDHGPSEPDDILLPGEIGEIVVRGVSVMAGYYKNEEATNNALYNGWYHTGDLGYFDADGYLWIVDRVDNMIVSGGENIYPKEVEQVFLEHPKVKDIAIIGVPDEKWGETVVAFIVRKSEEITAEDFDEFCLNSKKLAKYKRPRKYVFLDELPRNASGKLQKFKLKERIKDKIGQ